MPGSSSSLLAFAPIRWFLALWERVLAGPARKADAEAREFHASPRAAGFDRRLLVVFLVSTICLILLEYVGMSNRYRHVLPLLETLGMPGAAEWLDHTMRESENHRINRLTWWGIGCFVFYFVIPAFFIRFVLRERLADYGLRMGDAFRDAWIYVLFFAVMLPIVFIVSFDPHFQSTYPFYRPGADEGLWPHFWRWQFLYLLQFFALEFFFRGFMVHGLKHRLGFSAVFVMMIPYTMIHFGKPMAETVGAIIAGIVLGALSLKNRSIWMGVVIHCAVALAMDFFSLWQMGRFG